MTIVSISFTSESCDRYLSLFTDIKGPKDLVSRLKEEYMDEFGYLRIDSYATDSPDGEAHLIAAVRAALEEEGIYD